MRSWFVFRMIEYMFRRREQSSHFKSLFLSKAILHHLFLRNNTIKPSARFLASLAVAAGSIDLNAALQNRWISNIKYYNRIALKVKVEGIDLEVLYHVFWKMFISISNANLLLIKLEREISVASNLYGDNLRLNSQTSLWQFVRNVRQ